MKRLLILSIFLGVLLAGCGHPVEGGIVFRTADPNLSLFMPVAQAPAPDVEPDVVPNEEVGEEAPDPTPEPPCEIVKGNISRSGEKIYHVEGQANYNQVKIDEAAGEAFFCNEEEAVTAGWRKAQR
jgi:hypothetical protein